MWRDKKSGFVLAIISAVCWGTYGVFFDSLTKGGLQYATVIALAPATLVIFFSIKMLIQKNRGLRNIPIKIYIIMIAHGVIGIFGMNLCYAKALATTPVGVVSVVAFAHVILLMISNLVVFGYKITVRKVLTATAAAIGIWLVLKNSGDAVLSGNVIWLILIPVVLAIGYTLNKWYLQRGVDADSIILVTNIVALLTVFAFQSNPIQTVKDILLNSAQNPILVIIILGFALIPQIGSFMAYYAAYERIEPVYVSISYSLDPVTSLCLGMIFFQQYIRINQIVGVIIIIIAVTLTNIWGNREENII